MFTVYHKHKRRSCSSQSGIQFIAPWLIGRSIVTERASDDIGSLNSTIFVAKLFGVGNIN